HTSRFTLIVAHRQLTGGTSSPHSSRALLVPSRDPDVPRRRPPRGAVAVCSRCAPGRVRPCRRPVRGGCIRKREIPLALLPVGPARSVRLVLHRRRVDRPCFANVQPVRSMPLAAL